MATTEPRLGHLAELGVQIHNVTKEDEDDNTEVVSVFIWTPNQILPEHKRTCEYSATYYDVMESCRWDDWVGDFWDLVITDDNWAMTGCYELNNEWFDVPFDDPRIQIAYTNPLSKPHKFEIRK